MIFSLMARLSSIMDKMRENIYYGFGMCKGY